MVKIWDYPKASAPTEKDGLYFYFRNDGLQNQSVLYYKKGLESEEIELLDPNNFDKEGTVSLSNACISEDCKYLVYAISRAGSDWREIYVRDIETLKDIHIPSAIKQVNIERKNGFFCDLTAVDISSNSGSTISFHIHNGKIQH